MPDPLKIIVLEGDETGQELLEQSLRVLDPELLGLPVELERFTAELCEGLGIEGAAQALESLAAQALFVAPRRTMFERAP